MVHSYAEWLEFASGFLLGADFNRRAAGQVACKLLKKSQIIPAWMRTFQAS